MAMPTLIIDLDETLVCVSTRIEFIHKSHSLTREQSTYTNDGAVVSWFIINPDEISDLIQHACDQNYDLMILTSGAWPTGTRHKLAQALDLDEKAKEKLKTCRFHNITSDAVLLNRPTKEIRIMSKFDRLTAIIEKAPELSGRNFVLLDDSEDHCNSFANCSFVEAILAHTYEEGKQFYLKAKLALERFATDEQLLLNLQAHPLPQLENHSFFFYSQNDNPVDMVDPLVTGLDENRMTI